MAVPRLRHVRHNVLERGKRQQRQQQQVGSGVIRGREQRCDSVDGQRRRERRRERAVQQRATNVSSRSSGGR